MKRLLLILFIPSILLFFSCSEGRDIADPDVDVSTFAYVNTVMKTVQPTEGEIWHPGEEREIKWQTSKDVKQITIQLFKKTQFKGNLVKGHSTSKPFIWKIPESITPSHHYRIKLINSQNSDQTRTSEDFFILH